MSNDPYKRGHEYYRPSPSDRDRTADPVDISKRQTPLVNKAPYGGFYTQQPNSDERDPLAVWGPPGPKESSPWPDFSAYNRTGTFPTDTPGLPPAMGALPRSTVQKELDATGDKIRTAGSSLPFEIGSESASTSGTYGRQPAALYSSNYPNLPSSGFRPHESNDSFGMPGHARRASHDANLRSSIAPNSFPQPLYNYQPTMQYSTTAVFHPQQYQSRPQLQLQPILNKFPNPPSPISTKNKVVSPTYTRVISQALDGQPMMNVACSGCNAKFVDVDTWKVHVRQFHQFSRH